MRYYILIVDTDLPEGVPVMQEFSSHEERSEMVQNKTLEWHERILCLDVSPNGGLVPLSNVKDPK